MKKLVALGVALFFLPATAVAWAAGGATTDGYSPVAGAAQAAVQKPGSKGTLPFTGLSLTVVVVVGALLIVTGVLLRRRHRPHSS